MESNLKTAKTGLCSRRAHFLGARATPNRYGRLGRLITGTLGNRWTRTWRGRMRSGFEQASRQTPRCWVGLPWGRTVSAADEPDLIYQALDGVQMGRVPNDTEPATYGLDDPEVEGVAWHSPGRKRAASRAGSALRRRCSEFRWRAARPVPSASRPSSSRPRMSASGARCFFREDADRPRLRHRKRNVLVLYGLEY